MKQGQIVYVPHDTLETVEGKRPVKGGWAKLEQFMREDAEVEVWLVYYLDHRYELPTQEVFWKDNMPLIKNEKEVIMATRKTPKKAAKKAAKKKAAKKVVKKTATKAAPKKDGKLPLSKFVAGLIVKGGMSDEKMVEKVQSEYPKYKHTDLKTIAYYRRFINEGRMENSGFPKPKKPYEPIGGSKKTAEKKTAAKKAPTKSAKKKVAKRKR